MVLTLGASPGKLCFEVIDDSKERFDVKDELFSHEYDVQKLALVDHAKHLADARCRALLEARENEPDLRDLELHSNLSLLELLGRHVVAPAWTGRCGRRCAWDQWLDATRTRRGTYLQERQRRAYWRRVGWGRKVARGEAHIPKLVDHVALWMPAFVLAVTIDLDKLFQDGGFTTNTLVRKADRVVIMAVCLSTLANQWYCRRGVRTRFAAMLVIRVAGSKHSVAD